MKKELILVRGASGAGKTTFVNMLAGFGIDGPHKEGSIITTICADDYFTDDKGIYKFDAFQLNEAHKYCEDKCEHNMLKAHDLKVSALIMIHNTFTRAWEFKAYEMLAVKYGYKVTHIIIENRHQSNSLHGISTDIVEKQKDRFDIKL